MLHSGQGQFNLKPYSLHIYGKEQVKVNNPSPVLKLWELSNSLLFEFLNFLIFPHNFFVQLSCYSDDATTIYCFHEDKSVTKATIKYDDNKAENSRVKFVGSG